MILKPAVNADRRSRILPCLCLCLLTYALSSAAQNAVTADTNISKEGRYRLSFTTELDPLVINRMHRWTLHLADKDGHSVTGAQLTVVGGMPEHNHGLPTRPQVTRELGKGDYLLEGMRFHMSGNWQITVSVDARDGKDTVIIELHIRDAA